MSELLDKMKKDLSIKHRKQERKDELIVLKQKEIELINLDKKRQSLKESIKNIKRDLRTVLKRNLQIWMYGKFIPKKKKVFYFCFLYQEGEEPYCININS